jgi:hypothetical protein
VADDYGNFILNSGSATFEGNSESITITLDAGNSVSHPNYDGDFIKGNDIAILKLVASAPAQIPGINHATSGSAVGNVVDKYGYGLSGYFNSGTDSSTYPFGTERGGQNMYDDFADTMYVALGLTSGVDFVPQAVYQFDSDDGSSSHDAFGFFFGISNPGLGNNEVMSASGDSGGPTILNGELVGVTSYGITLQYTNKQTSDCTKQRGSPDLDSSCGEFAGDTRVSSYSSWIDGILTPVIDVDSPLISEVNVDESYDSAIITWTTDEPATSVVDYGTENTYGSSVSDSNYVTSHSVEVTGLSSSTTYHFVVTSVDSSNNLASSSDTIFTTISPPVLESITISPNSPSITEGDTQQFTVTGTYSDGSDEILTDIIWSSSDGAVATIDSNGLASGISEGTTIITANFNGLEDTTTLGVTVAPEAATSVSVTSVEYVTEGGRFDDKHLLVTIALLDDKSNPVSGASVSIELFSDGSLVASGTGSSISDGSVTFSLKNAASSTYTTTVTGVTASGLTWDGVTPANSFAK